MVEALRARFGHLIVAEVSDSFRAMGVEDPDLSAGLAASTSVDGLVDRLRAQVEQRRRDGEYPPGLEEDLDAHFRELAAARRGARSLREHLEALRESSAFARERISMSSRVRAGSWLHRSSGRRSPGRRREYWTR